MSIAFGDERIEPFGSCIHRNIEGDLSGGSVSSESSSSIGKNSDDDDDDDDDKEEVQSQYNRGPLDSMDALEEVLPVKNGISKFYFGKSKSFTTLSDASSCSTIKDITKPENAYNTRKRKNLLPFNNNTFWDKNYNNNTRSSSAGISKRSSNSRSVLSLYSDTNNNAEAFNSNFNSSSPDVRRPPLPPHARKPMQTELSSSPPGEKVPPWRSFSLSDLQSAATAKAASPSVAV